ncbi:MAG: helix-turn-helix transcriptional regulator [Victivallales bacterium]|jgi:AraC-like DNA-binding protein
MRYFEGISFIGCGDEAQHDTIQKNRVFDNYYGIQYNHGGPMDFAAGDEPRRQVEGPYAFISRPRMKFYYGAPPGRTRHHVYVCFKGPRVDRFIRDGLLEFNRRQPLIRIVNSDRFLHSFRELVSNIGHNPQQNYDRAVLLLEDLLLQLREQPADKPEINSHLVPGLKQLENALKQAPQLEWDFFREASSLGISYPHFRRIFRQHTGASPVNYLIKCRLQMAALLLLRSSDLVSGIAEKCGIPDEFYFSRLFKKHYNLPPKTYRKEFRNQP